MSWTASRPLTVCEEDPHIVRILPRLLAVYGAISRELGVDLHFPGKALAYASLYQTTDARQPARAIVWMSQAPQCANEIFNVTNGDHFRWMHLWPAIADALDMKPGVPRPIRLEQVMADKESAWTRLVERHQLAPTAFSDAAIWSYGDYILGHDYDVMSDTTKLRQFGFQEVVPTQAMLTRMIGALRRARIVP